MVGRRALACTLVASGSLFAASSPASPVLDGVAAVVDDRPIFVSEVRARCRLHFAQVRRNAINELTPELVARIQHDVVGTLIDERIVEEEARAAHVVATEGDVRQAIAGLEASTLSTRAAMEQEARLYDVTPEEWLASIRRQVLEHKVLSPKLVTRIKVPRSNEREYWVAWDAERRVLLAELRGRHYVEQRW
jgi:hypothetical protein